MDFKQQLADFINKNNIVGVCAGVLIGLVTKELVLSLITDIITPLLVIGLLKTNITFIVSLLSGKNKSMLNVAAFFSHLFSWVLCLILTFLFVQFAFVQFLGVPEKGKDTKTKPDTKPKMDMNIDNSTESFFVR